MPALSARIAVALNMPNIQGRQKLDLEIWTRRVTASFNAIGETPDTDANDATSYSRLIETTDRLREPIAAANKALAPLVKRG
jgi:hypothetical protein